MFASNQRAMNIFSPAHPDEMINGTVKKHESWAKLYPNIGDKRVEFADSELIKLFHRPLNQRLVNFQLVAVMEDFSSAWVKHSLTKSPSEWKSEWKYPTTSWIESKCCATCILRSTTMSLVSEPTRWNISPTISTKLNWARCFSSIPTRISRSRSTSGESSTHLC